jgi:hypothetical protein
MGQHIEAVTPPLGDQIARLAIEFLDIAWAAGCRIKLERAGTVSLHRIDRKMGAMRAATRGLIPAIGVFRVSMTAIGDSAVLRSRLEGRCWASEPRHQR